MKTTLVLTLTGLLPTGAIIGAQSAHATRTTTTTTVSHTTNVAHVEEPLPLVQRPTQKVLLQGKIFTLNPQNRAAAPQPKPGNARVATPQTTPKKNLPTPAAPKAVVAAHKTATRALPKPATATPQKPVAPVVIKKTAPPKPVAKQTPSKPAPATPAMRLAPAKPAGAVAPARAAAKKKVVVKKRAAVKKSTPKKSSRATQRAVVRKAVAAKPRAVQPKAVRPAAPTVTPRAEVPLLNPQLDLRSSIVALASTKKGLPYVYGGTSPTRGFDCSGFTQWVFKSHGINLPRTARQQQAATPDVRAGDVKAGDLIFMGAPAYHVGIVADPERKLYWHAPRTGKTIELASWNWNKANFGRVLR